MPSVSSYEADGQPLAVQTDPLQFGDQAHLWLPVEECGVDLCCNIISYQERLDSLDSLETTQFSTAGDDKLSRRSEN